MTSELKMVDIPVSHLVPNPWNPNVMTEEELLKEMASITEFGFVDPMTVRWYPESGYYQIIDGEQRWTAAKRLKRESVPCIILEASDEVAEQLTIILNDLRGKPNEERLAALVRDLSTRRSMLDLEKVLPYKRERLAEMIAERKADFDWEALKRPKVEAKPEETRKWVERIYRLPHEAAQVIDDAIAKVRSEEGITEDWAALELIAADYMAGA
jgi:ParB/RepB/Spo0J family partition protein